MHSDVSSAGAPLTPVIQSVGRQRRSVDVRYFLKKRTAFIRQLYDAASSSYLERKRKIEAEEDPFVPPYSEDEEPAFLEEWIEADESLHVLAYLCISMLAAALHLYFKTLEREFGVAIGDSFKSEFKKGWLNGYKAFFAQRFDICFESGPANLEVLEEVVLARNRVQHPESITSHRTRYSKSDTKKLSHPFFVDDSERSLLSGVDEAERSWLMSPTLHVTGEKLFAAIDEAEKFVDWLEIEIDKHVYKR